MVPNNEVIIAQMAQAQAENRTHFRSYIVTRDYKLFGQESHLEFKSRVIAEITVVPPDSKKYTIENSQRFWMGRNNRSQNVGRRGGFRERLQLGPHYA